MKGKKIKKLVHSAIEEYRSLEKKTDPWIATSEPQPAPYNYHNPYDERQSARFYKMCVQLLKSDDAYGYLLSTDEICIGGTFGLECVDIKITKKGYRISTWRSGGGLIFSGGGNNFAPQPNHSYKDETVFEKLLSLVEENEKRRSLSAFDKMVDDIYATAGIRRESNLDEILEQ